MQHLGFRSLFAKLFASVMLALILFAVAMVLLTQLVHDKDAGIRSEVLATQILGQIDPFLHELNTAISKDNRLQSRFMLAVVKKSFDIFDIIEFYWIYASQTVEILKPQHVETSSAS